MPKFANAHTAAEAEADHRHHRHGPGVPRLHEVLPVPDRAWFRRCAIRQEDAPDGGTSRAGSCTGGIRAGCFLVRQQKCFGLPAVFAGAAGGVGGRGMRGMVYELFLRCGYLRESRLGNSAAFR